MYREQLIELVDLMFASVDQALAALERIPGSFWRTQPDTFFGPGEQLVHVCQSAGFAARFISTQAAGQEFPLMEPFASAAMNRSRLAKLNLEGARGQFNEICVDIDTFRVWVHASLQRTREKIAAIPEEQYGVQVSHPLVVMKGIAHSVLIRLILINGGHHIGQFNQLVKAAGYVHEAVFPVIFGEFLEEE